MVPRSLLFDYDIQTRINAALGSSDTAHLYESIAHNFSSLDDKDFDMTFP